jgi:hypothetical protein
MIADGTLLLSRGEVERRLNIRVCARDCGNNTTVS